MEQDQKQEEFQFSLLNSELVKHQVPYILKYKGGGNIDFNNAQRWVDMLNGNNNGG
jgi:hypothetical protein